MYAYCCAGAVLICVRAIALGFLHQVQHTLTLWDLFPDGFRVALAGGLRSKSSLHSAHT